MQTTDDAQGPFDGDGNYVLVGSGHDWSASIAMAPTLSRDRKFRVAMKVKVSRAGTAFSGLHFGIHGYAPRDTMSRTYRRHVALFWDRQILSQMYANGTDDWRGSTLSPEVKADTWYEVELLGNRSGSAISVWESGAPKPAYPQSILYSSDWAPQLNIWLYAGTATFKDFEVVHESGKRSRERAALPYGDAFNMTHQRYAGLMDYMGPDYFAGAFASLAKPVAGDTLFTAIGSKDWAVSATRAGRTSTPGSARKTSKACCA